MEHNPYESSAETRATGSMSFDWRWLTAIALIAITVLFAALPLMLTLLVLLACNIVALLALLVARQKTAANLTFLTGLLVFASFLFTDFGFSTPKPQVVVCWGFFIPAIISQLALIACPFWLS